MQFVSSRLDKWFKSYDIHKFWSNATISARDFDYFQKFDTLKNLNHWKKTSEKNYTYYNHMC